jgi:hypothetical protein
MVYEFLGDGQQQDYGQWGYNGCHDGLQQGGGTAMVAKMAMATVLVTITSCRA